MRVLVTGASGFLGSHVTRQLVARGDDVTVVDVAEKAPREDVRYLHIDLRAADIDESAEDVRMHDG